MEILLSGLNKVIDNLQQKIFQFTKNKNGENVDQFQMITQYLYTCYLDFSWWRREVVKKSKAFDR